MPSLVIGCMLESTGMGKAPLLVKSLWGTEILPHLPRHTVQMVCAVRGNGHAQPVLCHMQVEKAGGFSRSDSLCVSGLDVKIEMQSQSQSRELLCWRQ